jgi:hypothetical protein
VRIPRSIQEKRIRPAHGRCGRKYEPAPRDRGWHLDNLDILVDAEGLLILISYRSRIIVPGTLEREAVDTCLAEADVTRPPPGA